VFPLVTHHGCETDDSDDGPENSQFDLGNAMAPFAFLNSISHMRRRFGKGRSQPQQTTKSSQIYIRKAGNAVRRVLDSRK
jgi:hypothetical protein